MVAQGNHAQPFGVNIEGLKRRGFDKPTLHAICNVYKLIYRSGRTLEDVMPEIENMRNAKVRLVFSWISSQTLNSWYYSLDNS